MSKELKTPAEVAEAKEKDREEQATLEQRKKEIDGFFTFEEKALIITGLVSLKSTYSRKIHEFKDSPIYDDIVYSRVVLEKLLELF